MVGSPSYLILLSHIAGPRDSLCDICYTTHHLSLCILLISREYLFVTSFLQLTFSSFPNTSLPHPLCRIFFSFCLSLSSLTLSLHWVIDLSASHLALCWALYFQTPPPRFFPLLDLSYQFFFCLSLRFIKEYPKLVVSVCVWPLCPSFSLCLCLSLPYRSSSLSVCQVLLNPCQSGGIHR